MMVQPTSFSNGETYWVKVSPNTDPIVATYYSLLNRFKLVGNESTWIPKELIFISRIALPPEPVVLQLNVTNVDHCSTSSPGDLFTMRKLGQLVPDSVELFGYVFTEGEPTFDPETNDVTGWRYTNPNIHITVTVIE